MKSKVPVVKAIKTPAAYIHPDAPYEMLPKHEFSMALIVSTFSPVNHRLQKDRNNYFLF